MRVLSAFKFFTPQAFYNKAQGLVASGGHTLGTNCFEIQTPQGFPKL
jgi:hypothetical protein